MKCSYHFKQKTEDWNKAVSVISSGPRNDLLVVSVGVVSIFKYNRVFTSVTEN